MSSWLSSISSAYHASLESETWATLKEKAETVSVTVANAADAAVNTVSEYSEQAYTSASTIAEKQLHSASIALLQSEIAEKKREWGEVAWKKMAEGDLQAVTAIFEKYQAKIQELEQQIATKEQQIADLDSTATVQLPEAARVVVPPASGDDEEKADEFDRMVGAADRVVGASSAAATSASSADAEAAAAREAAAAAAREEAARDAAERNAATAAALVAATTAPPIAATVVAAVAAGEDDEDGVVEIPMEPMGEDAQETVMDDSAPPPRPGLPAAAAPAADVPHVD